MFNILVVEDDRNTRKLMEAFLKKEGFNCFLAADGQCALDILDCEHIDLILLDVMMPNMDGYEFSKTLREADNFIPIIMTTAKQLKSDKTQGFLVGTDDYMIKPIDFDEMVLRIRALLRRSKIISERKLVLSGLELFYDTLTVCHNGEKFTLPQKEFYLLYKLLSYPDKIFTRIELMDEIWGMDSETADTTVNVHINRLRKRFENYDEFELVAVRGLGYKAVKKI